MVLNDSHVLHRLCIFIQPHSTCGVVYVMDLFVFPSLCWLCISAPLVVPDAFSQQPQEILTKIPIFKIIHIAVFKIIHIPPILTVF